jgi:hypothetical protein
MAANPSAWNTHVWEIRQVEVKPGVQAVQRTCQHCSRHFIDESASGAKYAVHIGMLQFDRLSEEVTERWLAQACPGRLLDSDFADLGNRYERSDSPSKSNTPERPEPEE